MYDQLYRQYCNTKSVDAFTMVVDVDKRHENLFSFLN